MVMRRRMGMSHNLAARRLSYGRSTAMVEALSLMDSRLLSALSALFYRSTLYLWGKLSAYLFQENT